MVAWAGGLECVAGWLPACLPAGAVVAGSTPHGAGCSDTAVRFAACPLYAPHLPDNRRRDPDFVPAQRGLKRLRSVLGGKERGNAAFAAGSWQEAHEHYSRALAADPDLRTQFVAQVG